MKDQELKKERDRDLYETYLRGLREMHFSNMHDAADWCRMQPARQFYISSKALVNYIGAMKNGVTPPKMFSQNEKKIKHLYAMYLKFIAENPDCRLTREYICDMLVNEPAPQFFIGHESALYAIRRERQAHLERIGR